MRYRRVIVVMGPQMGKTANFLNVMGQRLDDAPVPMLYIGPTKSNVDRVIEPQVVAMLKSVPSLWAKTDSSRKAQKLAKLVNGVTLRLAWAGSPTEMASMSAHTVLVDELDRMKPIPGEGDPVTLAEARTSNYAGGRIIITSTPTGGNVDVQRHPETGIEHWKEAKPEDLPSAIWRLWQEGTRFEWAVPCPHCESYFVPRFRNLWWPENATPRIAEREARLVCPECAAQIDDDRDRMNARGKFLAPGQRVENGVVVGHAPDSDTASFWVSALMSPWISWGKRAAAWIRATNSGDQERIRATINLGFGEPYAFKGDALPADVVRDCIGQYKSGTIPPGVKRITCGVDVQKRKLVYAVRGWGFSMESWLLDAGELWGETEHEAVWQQLGDLLETDYDGMRIKRMGIDSGYRPGDKWRRPDNMVYAFCMQHRGRAVPTKGRDHLPKPYRASMIDVNWRGALVKNGLQLWHIDTDFFKSLIMARYTWPADKPGRFWVPTDVSDDYCLQMTSESRVSKPSGASVWIKVRPDNHFLDAETINFAMAQSLGYHRRIRRESQETASPPVARPLSAAPSLPKPVIQKKQMQPGPRRPGNWVTRW